MGPSGKIYTPAAWNVKWCFLSSPIGLFVICGFEHCNLEFVCILYFVISFFAISWQNFTTG
jgi:formate/nitrite transporter FocA (FNT family)